MRIWHWQALKNVRLNQQKRNPPYYCDNCFTTLLGLILATNSLFNTSPSSLDLVFEIAYRSKVTVHLESLPLKCSTWAWSDIQQGWHGPPPQVVTKTLQPKKVARIANLVICYSLLIWPEWCDSYVFLIHTAHPFKINAKSHLVRRLDNLDPAGRKRLCEENFCWRFLVHVLLRVRHRFHLNLKLLSCHHISQTPSLCLSNLTHPIQSRLIGIDSTVH